MLHSGCSATSLFKRSNFVFLVCVLSAASATTVPVPCATPNIPNAEIVTDDYDYGDASETIPSGDMVSIQCRHGYTSAATTTMFKCENGNWNPQLPTCLKAPTATPSIPQCKLPPLLYGTIKSLSYSAPNMVPVGNKIHISCNPGFRLEGVSDLRCNTDRRWDEPPPICLPLASKTCQIPNIRNSRIKIQKFDISNNLNIRVIVGEEIDIGCVPGYQRVGTRYITCKDSDSWSHQPPVCRVRIYQLGKCFLPKVANGQYLNISQEEKGDIEKNGLDKEKYQNHTHIAQGSDGTELLDGITLAVRCDSNYELVGNPVVQCDRSAPVAKDEWPRCRLPGQQIGHGGYTNYSDGGSAAHLSFVVQLLLGFSLLLR